MVTIESVDRGKPDGSSGGMESNADRHPPERLGASLRIRGGTSVMDEARRFSSSDDGSHHAGQMEPSPSGVRLPTGSSTGEAVAKTQTAKGSQ